MSFFRELKRRNVFRVGIAYVVGGWLLLQLTDVLSQLLDLPEVVGRVIVLLVAIGLPVALFFAWAFEMTPEGVKREKDVDRNQSITPQTGKKLNNTILVMMALAIAHLLYDKLSGPAQTAQTGSEPFSQQTAGEIGEKRALTPIEGIDDYRVSAEAVSAHGILGNKQLVSEMVDHVRSTKPADAVEDFKFEFQFAQAYAYAGMNAECIEILESLLSGKSEISVPWLELDPAFNRMRNEPEFVALLERHR